MFTALIAMKAVITSAILLQVLSQHIESTADNHTEDLAEELFLHQDYASAALDPMELMEVVPASYIAQWSETIEGLEIADMVTVEIEPRASLELFEEIGYLPAALKGAYFASSHENAAVAVKILDPEQTVVYEYSGEREGLFAIEAKLRGRYHFTFTNKQVTCTAATRDHHPHHSPASRQLHRATEQRPHHSYRRRPSVHPIGSEGLPD